MPGALGRKRRVSQRTTKEVKPVRFSPAATTTRRKYRPLSVFVDNPHQPNRWKFSTSHSSTVDRRPSPSAADASGSVPVHISTPVGNPVVPTALPWSHSDTSKPSRASTRPVVDTLIQEKTLLERKLAAVNFVLELEQQGDNFWDSDGDGSHAVVDDDGDDHFDDDGSHAVLDDDDDGNHSDEDGGQAVVDDNDGEFWDDDNGDRKQQQRSLHEDVESTNPHDNGDSGSHHGNRESTSLHSNREMSIRHDNGEAVSLHDNSGNHHRHQQQAGVQRVHGKTSCDTDKDTDMEEEDEGKEIVEADSTGSIYGDGGQQQAYDSKGDDDQQQSHRNSNTELQRIFGRTTSASYHSNTTSTHPHSNAELHQCHENTELDCHHGNKEAVNLNSNAELHSVYSKGESARLHSNAISAIHHSNATSMSFPSNATSMSHPSNATSASFHGNQQQQWQRGVPLNLIRRHRDLELEFGEQHPIQQLLEQEEIRHGQQR
jgi:hypothetical protein